MSLASTRPAAVAGLFYPAGAAELALTVDRYLGAKTDTSDAPPKVLVAPHAGYVYSGAMAGRAYALLAPLRRTIKRVVLFGPTHRVAVDGLALPEATAFATPLGEIALDEAAMDSLADLPQVVRSDRVHAQEHSLEVHLPFLQRALDDFRLVPLAVGHATPEAVAEVIERLWGGPETLLVFSTDLSHYQPYAVAQQIDGDTCRHILAGDMRLRPEQACGAYPLNGLLLAARRHGLRAHQLGLCNSGDTAGDRQRVVGYAAFAFSEEADHV